MVHATTLAGWELQTTYSYLSGGSGSWAFFRAACHPRGVEGVELEMPKGLWIPCALAVLGLAGCASSAPAPPQDVNPELVAHCRNLLYIGRLRRGPPNWLLYDQCMRGTPWTQ